LIDELVLRVLMARPKARVAILSHDPSIIGKGALLGDRATMIHSQHDRVFMRSFATRGRAGGLSVGTERSVRAVAACGFDVVFIETVGIGQEAVPFRRGLVDQSVLVMSPDYGARLQLQKIAMLDAADVIVVNKSDLPGAATASSEIEQRLGRQSHVIGTVAKRHRDAGVDGLFEALELA
jgi:methylmalonyl-CoA mutase